MIACSFMLTGFQVQWSDIKDLPLSMTSGCLLREATDCIHRSVIQCSGTLCQAGLIFNRDRGRPRFKMSRAQLEFFVKKGFKAAEIAQLFVTSPNTVERRLAEFGC